MSHGINGETQKLIVKSSKIFALFWKNPSCLHALEYKDSFSLILIDQIVKLDENQISFIFTMSKDKHSSYSQL